MIATTRVMTTTTTDTAATRSTARSTASTTTGTEDGRKEKEEQEEEQEEEEEEKDQKEGPGNSGDRLEPMLRTVQTSIEAGYCRCSRPRVSSSECIHHGLDLRLRVLLTPS